MNLLFDSLNKPNLDSDYLDSTWYGYFHTGSSFVPQIFYPYRDLIQLYDIEQIDDLDFFIYPINFCDPFYHPTLNESGKFLANIDERILKRVKNNKGIILIDATYESFGVKQSLKLKWNIKKFLGTDVWSDDHYEDALKRVAIESVNFRDEDDEIIPKVEKTTDTDNIFLNTRLFHLFPDDNFFTNFPSFLEFKYFRVYFDDEVKGTENKKFCLFGSNIDKHHGGFSLIRWLKHQKLTSQGYISLSRVTEDINSNEIILPFLDIETLNYVKFNIVVESWFTNEPYVMLTEKTYRNIHFRKPFVMIGQHNSLKQFRAIGYKTYNEVFDESYDTEKDDNLRLTKAFKLIKRLIDEPEEFWQKNKEKLENIHDHNVKINEERELKLLRFYDTLRQR